jgi:hypothetical protein
MPVAATITKEQRDGLYELVRHHLYSIDDLWTAFGRSRDYSTAERFALEFGEDFRLLADIGWAADDDRERFELTMPSLDLTELLRRLHAEAEKVLVESGTEREASEDDARADERFQIGHDACEKVMADLNSPKAKHHERPQEGKAPSPRRAGRPGAGLHEQAP